VMPAADARRTDATHQHIHAYSVFLAKNYGA